LVSVSYVAVNLAISVRHRARGAGQLIGAKRADERLNRCRVVGVGGSDAGVKLGVVHNYSREEDARRILHATTKCPPGA
jgi:hypothetical protein